MSKSLELAAAIAGGLAMGTVLFLLLADRYGASCPVCGGKLVLEDGAVVCSSCGVRLRAEKSLV